MAANKRMYRAGDKIETWFSGEPDGKSVVLEVGPYTGKYKQWFTQNLRVSAPRTARRWLDICV